MRAGSFGIEIDLNEDNPVLRVRGELDVSSSAQLRVYAMKVLNDRRPSRLVIDVKDLWFIDSTGLGVLVSILKRLRSEDGTELVLRSPMPGVKKVIEITGLDKVFTLEA
jgi:anti-sigma B factor antagonist